MLQEFRQRNKVQAHLGAWNELSSIYKQNEWNCDSPYIPMFKINVSAYYDTLLKGWE